MAARVRGITREGGRRPNRKYSAGDRGKARDQIIAAANRDILRRRGLRARLLGARQLQRAVCIVRRRQLVKSDVLVLAGFNPKERR
jgi:hypothetical protein